MSSKSHYDNPKGLVERLVAVTDDICYDGIPVAYVRTLAEHFVSLSHSMPELIDKLKEAEALAQAEMAKRAIMLILVRAEELAQA